MVGYIEEDDEDASGQEHDGDGNDVAEAGDEKGDGEERRPSAAGAEKEKKGGNTLRIAGHAVVLMGRRGSALSGDPLVSTKRM